MSVFTQIHCEIPSVITEPVISSETPQKMKTGEKKRTMTLSHRVESLFPLNSTNWLKGIPGRCIPLSLNVCDSSDKSHIVCLPFTRSQNKMEMGTRAEQEAFRTCQGYPLIILLTCSHELTHKMDYIGINNGNVVRITSSAMLNAISSSSWSNQGSLSVQFIMLTTSQLC